ncbi:hypothetical protein PSSU_0271 [Pseudoscardovia suis]|uniref:Uncharacterized protein n=1 Tax=Pseudoscardovia suis TaxID=987063 RepID=A0A261F360_9BIFI|nr:hypothetical protein PSSU_0271 [Pseudoscardovia suis]
MAPSCRDAANMMRAELLGCSGRNPRREFCYKVTTV